MQRDGVEQTAGGRPGGRRRAGSRCGRRPGRRGARRAVRAACRSRSRVRLAKLERLRRRGHRPLPGGLPRTATSRRSASGSADLGPDAATAEQVVGRPAGWCACATSAGCASPCCGTATRRPAGHADGRPARPRRRCASGRPASTSATTSASPARSVTSGRGELSVLAAELGDHREVPAPAAGQAPRADRPGGPGAAALRRPDRQPRRPDDAAPALRRRARRARVPQRPRLPRGRDADAAAGARRRQRPAVRHPHQRLRHAALPAHRARAVPQAADGRRRREGLRAQPQLPQRGRRRHAQPRVHDARGVRGLRRLRHHAGADAGDDPAGGAGRVRRHRRRRTRAGEYDLGWRVAVDHGERGHLARARARRSPPTRRWSSCGSSATRSDVRYDPTVGPRRGGAGAVRAPGRGPHRSRRRSTGTSRPTSRR